MSARPSLAPRSLALVAMLFLAGFGLWGMSSNGGGRVARDTTSGGVARPGSSSLGPTQAEAEQLSSAGPVAEVVGDVDDGKRRDLQVDRWDPSYWRLEVRSPAGEPLPARGLRVSIDGVVSMGFTDDQSRLHLKRRSEARQIEVAMRSPVPGASWLSATVDLKDAEALAIAGQQEGQPLDLGTFLLQGAELESLLVLLPWGAPWSGGEFELNGQRLLLDADGRIPLPPHNRWGERLELSHSCLALPGGLPGTLGEDGQPLQLLWRRSIVLAMDDWDANDALGPRFVDPSKDSKASSGGAADDWMVDPSEGELRADHMDLAGWTVWRLNSKLPDRIRIDIEHRLSGEPYATRWLDFGLLEGNSGAPWVTRMAYWSELAQVTLIDTAGERIEGKLYRPGRNYGATAWDAGLAVASNEPLQIRIPTNKTLPVVALGENNGVARFEIQPGSQSITVAEDLLLKLRGADLEFSERGASRANVRLEGADGVQQGWVSDTRRNVGPDDDLDFRVPTPGAYRIRLMPANEPVTQPMPDAVLLDEEGQVSTLDIVVTRTADGVAEARFE